MKDQRDLIRAAHIQVIPNHAFKPHPACWRPVEHTSVGNLELTERHLISVSRLRFDCAKKRVLGLYPPTHDRVQRVKQPLRKPWSRWRMPSDEVFQQPA